MSVIDKNTRKLPDMYSSKQWELDFLNIKNSVQPSTSKKMKIILEFYGFSKSYHGKTQYQCYCDYINDILTNIRKGYFDYCYYPYQVAEILKYEHDNLQAVWLEEEHCFKLSLKK